MTNKVYMHEQFEAQKNFKAGTYTVLIVGAMLAIFLFVRWSLPVLETPLADEGIEVNLGNSDAGLGDDQPFLPGQPSPQDQQSYTPPKVAASDNTAVKDIDANEKDPDAAEIKKPPVTRPDAKKIPEKDIAKTTKKTTETNPAPVVPKPKAVFKGVNGTGTGGNEADSYKKGGNEGIAGGKGDQGRPGGDPDSKNYTGNGGKGNSGVSISRGLQGRSITKLPSFEDDFNENAKVAVDIRVDAQGNVISALYQPRGSTTAESSMKAIAIRKAQQIKFNSSGQESIGTIIFVFRLRN